MADHDLIKFPLLRETGEIRRRTIDLEQKQARSLIVIFFLVLVILAQAVLMLWHVAIYHH